tara:strand:- start:1796 stop:1939 length:144 start_codon:yes stop_codon:yes gene_type:complete
MNIISIIQKIVLKLCTNIDNIEKIKTPQAPKFPRFELEFIDMVILTQ